MQPIKNVLHLHNLATPSGIAAKMVPNQMSQTMSSNSALTERHKKRIDNLFLKLAAMYGHVWKSLYKSGEFLAFTKLEWLNALARFDDDIITKALLHSQNHWEYPPTLPQFIECCKTHSNRIFVLERHNTDRNIPVAHEALNKIRTILNMKPR